MKFNFNPVEPVRITSRFGKRNTGIKGASTFHNGVDLGANKAIKETPLILTNDATLITNAWNKYRGWYVIFKINNTYEVLYQHLKSKCVLKTGTKYEAGTVIGIMGNSSDKSVLKIATHLHFELHKNGNPIDPVPFLNNLEEYEVIKNIKVKVNGKIKEVKSINKDGENYIRLRDFDDVLDIAEVDYDSVQKLPVIED